MTDVWPLYDRHVLQFDASRGRTLREAPYLTAAMDHAGAGASVLDLGCGVGEPIARHLIEAGYRVTGVDAAPAMIEVCRRRFPTAAWLVADMRTLALAERFDTIVAWDSFFHLTRDEQRATFPLFRRHLNPGGRLLFTSGPCDGEVVGDLFGDPLFHASLAAPEYRALLAANGMRVLRHEVEDPHCGGHTVWLAEMGDEAAC